MALSLVRIRGEGATECSKGREPESAPLPIDLCEIEGGYIISKLAGIGKLMGYYFSGAV